jgi:tRNA/tmRNA/rRNA uracil-C5-methylase (TrmA/RlmC/RlmD family)
VIHGFDSCLLCPEIFDEIRERYITLLREENAAGDAKYIMIRTGEYGECSVVAGISGDGARTAALRLAEEKKEIVSLSVSESDSADSGAIELIYGKGVIREKMCGLDFDIAPGAFFQVNPPVAGRLIELVSDLLSPPEGSNIADLYCGTGAIGLSLAFMNPGISVTGIEINASAVECARMNASRSGILNCRFFCGDSSICSDVIGGDIYAAVIDPPRSGASGKMLNGLMGLSPKKIAYVSCNPSTLARDAAILCSGGYTLRKVFAADMFPCCAHVETVVLFEKDSI